MNTCENCGSRVYNGLCVNCDEESFIEEEQGEFIESRPDWWKEKLVEQQKRQVERLKCAPKK